MKKILFLCSLTCFMGSCALISFADNFQTVPSSTVAETLNMTDGTLVYLQGTLNSRTFIDESGEIKISGLPEIETPQPVEILAKTKYGWFSKQIDIINISPL